LFFTPLGVSNVSLTLLLFFSGVIFGLEGSREKPVVLVGVCTVVVACTGSGGGGLVVLAVGFCCLSFFTEISTTLRTSGDLTSAIFVASIVLKFAFIIVFGTGDIVVIGAEDAIVDDILLSKSLRANLSSTWLYCS